MMIEIILNGYICHFCVWLEEWFVLFRSDMFLTSTVYFPFVAINVGENKYFISVVTLINFEKGKNEGNLKMWSL
jgi:hypothetical protein